MPTRGTRLDLHLINNRFGQIMRLLAEKGDLAGAKTLMTTIVANLGTVNTYIQAAGTIQALPAEQSLVGNANDPLL